MAGLEVPVDFNDIGRALLLNKEVLMRVVKSDTSNQFALGVVLVATALKQFAEGHQKHHDHVTHNLKDTSQTVQMGVLFAFEIGFVMISALITAFTIRGVLGKDILTTYDCARLKCLAVVYHALGSFVPPLGTVLPVVYTVSALSLLTGTSKLKAFLTYVLSAFIEGVAYLSLLIAVSLAVMFIVGILAAVWLAIAGEVVVTNADTGEPFENVRLNLKLGQ
eukprot:GFYU01007843.1.p1 GENE.GFYU01007843.1~~GFYU01007843.1.p1  ORF type:complete len:221 (+),score=49.30 GFYU01007843.1:74-736(+)